MSRVLEELQQAEQTQERNSSAALDWDCTRRPFQVVTIASTKGGVGKTTIAANLAVNLRALREDQPVLLLAFDDQPTVDRMFALEGGVAPRTLAGALRAGNLAPAIRLGQYGVHYVAPGRDVSAVEREIDDPLMLRRVLLRTNWPGIVVVDTRSDVEIGTRTAIAASDLTIVVVKDQASLTEAQRVFRLLEKLGRPPDRARVLLSLVDRRVRYDDARCEDVLALLVSEVRRLGLPLFGTFLSRSPAVEALYTNPAGKALPVLHGAPKSLVHDQLRQLADDTLAALARVAPPALEKAAESSVFLKPLTLEAARVLPSSPLEIERFPFRIGRLDPAVSNDLAIPDAPPFQVSRSHLELFERDGRIAVLEKGSHWGTLVDGRRLGRSSHDLGPHVLGERGGRIVLGTRKSPYAFDVVVGARRAAEIAPQPAAAMSPPARPDPAPSLLAGLLSLLG